MYNLSKDNVDVIVSLVNNAGITYSHLREDLIDHLCCDIETEINDGSDFHSAYEKVRKKTGLRGLKKIQEDTILLINKKYRIMKNIMKIFGVITLILLAMGSLFKIFHWPFASIQIVLGFFLLVFVFFPATIWVLQKEAKFQSKTLFTIITYLSFTFFMVGVLFKVQHWPRAGVLLLTGVASITFLFLPFTLVQNLKQITDKKQRIIHSLGYISLIIYILGFLFKIFHWPGAAILLLVGSVCLTSVFLPAYTLNKFKETNFVSSQFIFMVIALIFFNMFTLLISVKSSKNVMMEFVQVNEEIASQSNILEEINTSYYVELEKEDSTYYELLAQFKEKSDELTAYIDDLKIGLIQFSEKVNREEAEQLIKDQKYIKNKDNGDVPLFVMIGENENGKAFTLKNKLQEYHLFVKNNFSHVIDPSDNLLKLISTEDPTDIYGKKHSWENYYFYHQSVISSISNLELIQRNVLLVESDILNALRNIAVAEVINQ
jgi:gliding motility-associated GldM-like protein